MWNPKKSAALVLTALVLTGCGDVSRVDVHPTPTTVKGRPVISTFATDPQAGLADAVAYVGAADRQRVHDAARLIVLAQAETNRSRPRPHIEIGTAARITINGTGTVNGYPCGGDLPACCTLKAESHGTPTAQNPTSSSSGLWQFTHDTWAGYGGYSEAKYAPAAVQNARAVQVFAGGRGASNWYGDGCYGGR